mgnify:CR=1 FL=1
MTINLKNSGCAVLAFAAVVLAGCGGGVVYRQGAEDGRGFYFARFQVGFFADEVGAFHFGSGQTGFNPARSSAEQVHSRFCA